MGTVYLARRSDDQFEKLVAIKLIRGGLSNEFLRRRFLNERQILARLEHPSIARLLDGGTTEDGCPWLAMEYVDGEPIDIWCERRELVLERRLELFIRVCDAVEYAHRSLIIHRDLKPGNVLVTEAGDPKLLDFGIAKVIDDAASEQTATLWRAMTPGYASPEQLRGEPIATTSDVYSLGVILYELLAGRKPWKVTTSNPQEVLRAMTRDAAAPSVAAAGMFDGRWCRRLRGDLDNIVLKALASQPQQRYASAALLADDLRRFLGGHPVEARAVTPMARAWKFARRNPVSVSAALAVALTLAGSSIYSAHYARVADRERIRAEQQTVAATARYRDAHRLAQSMLVEFPAALEAVPGTLEARTRIIRSAFAQLEKLRAEGHQDPALMADLALAYETAANTVLPVAEKETLRRTAISINESLLANEPHNPRYRSQLASSLAWLGNGLKLEGRHQEELAAYQRAANVAGSLAADHPQNDRYQRDLQEVLGDLGRAQAALHQFPEAIATQKRSLEMARGFASAHPDDADALRRVVISLHMLNNTLIAAGDLEVARSNYEEALTIAQPLEKRYPTNILHRRDLWLVKRNLGMLLSRAGKHDEALSHLRDALVLKQALFDADPEDRGHHRGLAITHVALGEALDRNGDHEGAIAAYRRAVDLGDQLLLIDPRVKETWNDVENEYEHLHEILVRMGRAAEAKAVRQREAEVYAKARATR
jgi:non-specific serine/threonine protein kinase/serine/threonine-protein kinase